MRSNLNLLRLLLRSQKDEETEPMSISKVGRMSRNGTQDPLNAPRVGETGSHATLCRQHRVLAEHNEWVYGPPLSWCELWGILPLRRCDYSRDISK